MLLEQLLTLVSDRTLHMTKSTARRSVDVLAAGVAVGRGMTVGVAVRCSMTAAAIAPVPNLLSRQFVLHRLTARDEGVLDLGMKASIEQVVPCLEGDVARGSQGAVVRGADLLGKTRRDREGHLQSFLVVGGY